MPIGNPEMLNTSISKCPPQIRIMVVNLNLHKLACPVLVCELQISARTTRCNCIHRRLCLFQVSLLQSSDVLYKDQKLSAFHFSMCLGFTQIGPSSPCFRWRLHRFITLSGFQETIFHTIFRFNFGVQIRYGILRSGFYHPYLWAAA